MYEVTHEIWIRIKPFEGLICGDTMIGVMCTNRDNGESIMHYAAEPKEGVEIFLKPIERPRQIDRVSETTDVDGASA